MKGARVTRKRVTVSLPILLNFFLDFHPSMIRALVDLTELGSEFAQDAAGADEEEANMVLHKWLDADIATDVLHMLLVDDNAVDEYPEGPLDVVLDTTRQTLTFILERPQPRQPRKRKPKPRTARDPDTTTPLPIRLLRSGDSMN